jgi:hypothetical protein
MGPATLVYRKVTWRLVPFLFACYILAYIDHISRPTSFTIGAALIPRSEVKKISATELNSGGYFVVELGVFLSQGKDADLSPATSCC